MSEPVDLRIRHCHVRVVRRGGWSWGPTVEPWLAGLARALPALVAGELGEQLADRSGTQAAPVKVRLRVSRQELLALAALAAGEGATLPPRGASIGPVEAAADPARLPDRLRARLREATRVALAEPGMASGWSSSQEAASLPASEPESVDAAGELIATLRAWQEGGSLGLRLAWASLAELEAWERELFVSPTLAPLRPPGVGAAEIERVVRAAAAALAGSHRRAAEIRVSVALSVHRVLGVHPGDPAVPAALAAVVTDEVADRPVTAAPAREVVRPAPRLARGTDQHVASVLPFLLLSSLARLGWLETAIGVVLAAEADAAALCTALAYKVLAAPERGWRRSSEATAAAACCAGRAEPLEDAALATLAAGFAGRTAGLDEAARRPFVAGHVAGDPLLITRARHADRDGWLLAEVNGAFPLAWSQDLPSPPLDELVLVPAASAMPELLARLPRFLTDAPPARGEHHTPVALRQGRAMAADAERLAAAWHAVAVDRPAAPRAHPDLDASLSLAVSLALADMSWRLFHEREPSDATLVLERFASLDARVTVDSEQVRVRLPLGRRQQDLARHGLLTDVPRLPWWDGRTVVFTGG